MSGIITKLRNLICDARKKSFQRYLWSCGEINRLWRYKMKKRFMLPLAAVLFALTFQAQALTPEQAKEALTAMTYKGMLSASVVCTLKPGDDVAAQFQAAADIVKPKIQAEPGNNGVLVEAQSATASNVFSFYGEWGSRDGVLDHMSAPHSVAFMAAIEPLLVNGLQSIDVTLNKKFK
jgi:quinol monooxygenase YgiN